MAKDTYKKMMFSHGILCSPRFLLSIFKIVKQTNITVQIVLPRSLFLTSILQFYLVAHVLLHFTHLSSICAPQSHSLSLRIVKSPRATNYTFTHRKAHCQADIWEPETTDIIRFLLLNQHF